MKELTFGSESTYYSKQCRLGYKSGKQYLCLEDGSIIPGQIESVVRDEINRDPIATVTFVISLDKVFLDDEVKPYTKRNNDNPTTTTT